MEFIEGIPVHPVASLFPMIDDESLRGLADDIRENGLREPIVLAHMGDGFDDEVLIDGRNRYRACLLAGVEPKFKKLHALPNVSSDEGSNAITEDSVSRWIVSHNLHRRHLSPSQRTAVAVEFVAVFAEAAKKRQIEALARGNETKHSDSSIVENLPQSTEGERRPPATDEAAELFGVSGRSGRDAQYVKNNDPDTFEKVKAGDVAVSRVGMPVKRPRIPVHGLTGAGWGTGPGGGCGGVIGRSVRGVHYPPKTGSSRL